MNNKKALAKTFWNIWEWRWVGWGNSWGVDIEDGWGTLGCAGDAGESGAVSYTHLTLPTTAY
ncbi:hypothetical protein, partial [Klebsiella pneumoniae]|uniref:hypothetical protein n=1 Tax=Klebsiella pneumoniae TaxID=573 RepID=UPI003BF053CC